jgi:hypothetical protein
MLLSHALLQVCGLLALWNAMLISFPCSPNPHDMHLGHSVSILGHFIPCGTEHEFVGSMGRRFRCTSSSLSRCYPDGGSTNYAGQWFPRLVGTLSGRLQLRPYGSSELDLRFQSLGSCYHQCKCYVAALGCCSAWKCFVRPYGGCSGHYRYGKG